MTSRLYLFNRANCINASWTWDNILAFIQMGTSFFWLIIIQNQANHCVLEIANKVFQRLHVLQPSTKSRQPIRGFNWKPTRLSESHGGIKDWIRVTNLTNTTFFKLPKACPSRAIWLDEHALARKDNHCVNQYVDQLIDKYSRVVAFLKMPFRTSSTHDFAKRWLSHERSERRNTVWNQDQYDLNHEPSVMTVSTGNTPWWAARSVARPAFWVASFVGGSSRENYWI
jgi:hypothetical protein